MTEKERRLERRVELLQAELSITQEILGLYQWASHKISTQLVTGPIVATLHAVEKDAAIWTYTLLRKQKQIRAKHAARRKRLIASTRL